ncbi:MAG: yehT [Myxococcaceae bacterium]|nr:yehT [Myxococcaceae bacterium]
MLRVLNVDDEAPARAKVAHLLATDPQCVIVGEARDGLEALTAIEALAPDLLILDVQMPELDGFELLSALGDTQPAVVFSTAYDSYALRAFDAHAVDYLLKPYDERRFRAALGRAVHACAAKKIVHRPLLDALGLQAPQRLALKSVDGPWVRLDLERVLRISAANKYTCIYTFDGELIVRKPLRELEQRLDARFVCTHRSEVVNVDAVVRVTSTGYGDAELTLRDGSRVPLARSRRAAFMAAYRR